MRGELRFAVLGPVRAWKDEIELDLGQPQQRAVLAALLMHEGAQVTLDELIDGLWGDAAPATAARVIRSYVYRLRLILDQAGPAGIQSATGGYALDPGPRFDLAGFTGLTARARQARRDGDPATAAGCFAEGLRLWSGTALAGIPGPCAAGQRTRLTELRLTAQEEYLACALDLGSYDQAAAQLATLAAAHPLRERLRELQMHALYGAGRQAEALAAFRQASRLLRDELGIDPGPALSAMHQRILSTDPALLRTAAAVLMPSPAAIEPQPVSLPAPVPAQLPADIAHFTGRDSHLQALTALAADAGRAVMITAIGGTAGIGKTALAVHWAHRHTGLFPDGQLYVNLRGFDPASTPLAAGTAIRGFLEALGVPAARIPADTEAQAALYRSLLAGQRMLVVLDNARDPAQVRPLLPGTADSMVLVTSRSRLTGLAAADGARTLTLDLLAHHEARELLTRRLGTERVTAEPEAAQELIELCARLPLALNITAARAAAHPGFPLTAFATQLRQARGRLAALDTDDAPASVRAVFSWSYLALSPAAARAFRLLGLHPGPDATVPAVASLIAASHGQAAAALDELAAAHLLTEHSPGRYTFHDLLRAYAADQASTHDTEEERRNALHRVLDHYLHTAYAADRLLQPVWEDMAGPAAAQPGAAPEELADDQQAWHWLEAEHPAILASITQAAARGFDLHACQLFWTVAPFLDRRGKWHDSLAAQATSLAAACRLGNLVEQARAYRVLGNVCERLGSYPDAHVHQQRAFELYRQLGDQAGQASADYNRAATFELQGRYREALDHARQALERYRAAGCRSGQAMALNAVGRCWSHLGDHQQALAHCQQALALYSGLDIRTGEAGTFDSLGYAHHHLGHHRQAIECYHRALELFRKIRHHYYEADTLSRLGDTHHAAGDHEAARGTWEQARAIYETLQHPNAEAVRQKLKALT